MRRRLLKKHNNNGLLYELPEPTTFVPEEQKFIDTGIKMFKHVEMLPNYTYTILADIERGENMTDATNTYCAAHCMEEVQPYPGISIAMWENKNLGLNLYSIYGAIGTLTDNRRKVIVIVIHDGKVLMKYCNYKTQAFFTTVLNNANITGYNASVDKTLLLGCYQESDGTKGRFFDGTIHRFKLYDSLLDDTEINSFCEIKQ